MTGSSSDQDHSAVAAAPPPGCPAHGRGPGGVRRLYGPQAEADPAGLYEELRSEHGPVAPVLLHGDVPAWLILGYQENLDVMRNSASFTRDSRIWVGFQEGTVPDDWPLLPMVAWQPLCILTDGLEHLRLRKAVTDSLGRVNRSGVRRYITRFTDQLVDDFVAEGRADLVFQFAEQLPMLVLTQLMGMPEEYGPELVEATRDLMKGSETALASNAFVNERLAELVRRKKVAADNDLASWLLGHESRLTDTEVVEHLRLVLVAANETTVNLIADTLRMLLTDPRFRASLSGGQMTLPDAVEQVLWDGPPLSAIPGRWVVDDTLIGDTRVGKGDLIMLGLAAGNVDPRVRPDRSAPMHGNRAHLAFSSGSHECPGQDIGRAITQTCIDALFLRLPDMRLAVPETELRWQNAWMSRHLAELPVTFTPGLPMSAQESAAAAPPAPGGSRPLPEAEPAPSARPPKAEPASLLRTLARWLGLRR